MPDSSKIALRLRLEDAVALVFFLVSLGMRIIFSELESQNYSPAGVLVIIPAVFLLLLKELVHYFVTGRENGPGLEGSLRSFVRPYWEIVRDWFPFLIILMMYYSLWGDATHLLVPVDRDKLLIAWDQKLVAVHRDQEMGRVAPERVVHHQDDQKREPVPHYFPVRSHEAPQAPLQSGSVFPSGHEIVDELFEEQKEHRRDNDQDAGGTVILRLEFAENDSHTQADQEKHQGHGVFKAQPERDLAAIGHKAPSELQSACARREGTSAWPFRRAVGSRDRASPPGSRSAPALPPRPGVWDSAARCPGRSAQRRRIFSARSKSYPEGRKAQRSGGFAWLRGSWLGAPFFIFPSKNRKTRNG